jgi:hypothetical protein
MGAGEVILEAVVGVGGGAAAVALAWARVHRVPTESSCERMHHVAAMERDIYGQVMSPDAAEHVKKCAGRWAGVPFERHVTAAVPVYRDGALAARAGEPLTVRAEDVRQLRELVAEVRSDQTGDPGH